MPQKIIKKVRQSYTFKEKVNVIQYALREGNLRATTKFDLDKTQVGHWVTKLKDKLDEVKHRKSCHLKGGGRKSFFPDEEIQLYRWISEMHSAALAVTYNSLKFEMLRIVYEMASKSNDLEKRQLASKFKASSIGGSGKTKKGNLKCAELRTVCEWVLAAWAEINPEIIRRAFRKCSISNAMDGSEDNEIYYDEILDNKTDGVKENNPDMDSGDSDENEDDFEDKKNLDATIEENEDVLLFTID
ncbi:12319_t:CDS:2 [Gigaspora margarita]|uniref:12319_t:CDS:1 n=1 Tax=Gigaspora margarita TaxID=4874 RepID=A0ABN7W304_GIGMA|nr:12319_t:CDS:2 [Gigaspora margarita]